VSIEYKAAQVIAQSKSIDTGLEKLQVTLANQVGAREPDEEDAVLQLAIAAVRQILDNQRLITVMLQALMWELAPARYTSE
jgi:hypothetical protein